MGYPQQGTTREHPEGTKVLILGVLGLVLCQILAPFAWASGNRVLKQVDASPETYSNRGSISAGRILGIVGTVFLVIYLLSIVAIVLITVASDGTSSALGAVG